MRFPTVSVVLPVYNARPYVAEAIDSVLGQTFGDFELILVNDGSTDGSGEVLRAARDRDRRVVLVEQENRGLIVTLNEACARAKGKYIARMDADDICLPDRLARQVAFLDEHPNVAALGGSAKYLTESGLLPRQFRNPTDSDSLRTALETRSALIHPTVTMRRDAFLAVGGYRSAFVDAEDYDLWLRMSERYDLNNLDAVVLHYRLHAGQVSVRKMFQQGLSHLGARASARLRRETGRDPAEGARTIDVPALLSMGVPWVEIEGVLLQAARERFHDTFGRPGFDDRLKIIAELESLIRCWPSTTTAGNTIQELKARALLENRDFLGAVGFLLAACRRRPTLLARVGNAVASAAGRRALWGIKRIGNSFSLAGRTLFRA